MNTKLNDFKEVMHKGMIENFTKDGFLTPILFFFQDDKPVIGIISYELLSTAHGKKQLAAYIKNKCCEPNVTAGGIIMEAYGAKIFKDNIEAEKIMKGEINISEMNNAKDIIIMIFSTPEKEETFTYVVDCETKTVKENFSPEETEMGNGIFNDFFKWRKN